MPNLEGAMLYSDLAVLGTQVYGLGGWQRFLVAPHPALGWRSPRDMIEGNKQGPVEEIVQAARRTDD